MGSRIKCLKCGDIIEGDDKGTYITCKCKSCYIDETKWYARCGGDPKYIVDADAEPEAEGQLSIYDLDKFKKCDICGNEYKEEELYDTEGMINGGVGFCCEQCLIDNDIKGGI